MFLNVFAMHENILMTLNYNKTISLGRIFLYKKNIYQGNHKKKLVRGFLIPC